MKLLVTGGCGFIGSAVVREAIARGHSVWNIDALTYAGNPSNLQSVADNERYFFQKADISQADSIDEALQRFEPDVIMHLAAESHVDRSIENPLKFVETNVLGTVQVLNAALRYFSSLTPRQRETFRFHHVSTDEVFGTLDQTGRFGPDSCYAPNSPYAASKAASDHFVRAWGTTYGLPVVLSNCSNNYGPFQFPEKLIPVVIHAARDQRAIPIYGDGQNVRDWLHVDDHACALFHVAEHGQLGETYLIGGDAEVTNLDLVKHICATLDRLHPRETPYADLIEFVPDRLGHDFRYAIDATKTHQELGWRPRKTLQTGLEETINWYLDHEDWCHDALSRAATLAAI